MNLFDFSISAALFLLGFYFAVLTPPFRGGYGLKTIYTVRGKEEWKYGHKFLGTVLMICAIVTAYGVYFTKTHNINLHRYYILAIYGTILVMAMPLMHWAINMKFGKDQAVEDEVSARSQKPIQALEQFKKSATSKNSEKKKEADKRRKLREEQRVAKKRKKEKSR